MSKEAPPNILPVPAGGVICSASGRILVHASVNVGFPADFTPLMPDNVVDRLRPNLRPDCQYEISKRNFKKSGLLSVSVDTQTSGMTLTDPSKASGGLVLMEVSEGYKDGAIPGSFEGTRRSYEETLMMTISAFLTPHDEESYDLLGNNCQDFVIRMATTDRTSGCITPQHSRNTKTGLGVAGGSCGIGGLALCCVGGPAAVAAVAGVTVVSGTAGLATSGISYWKSRKSVNLC